tara:strand:- start:129 stop:815 length:687 start_codon:yes stop_codon:yes gene_type:complete
MKISIIIPCFNEVDTIELIIKKIQEEVKIEKEIIVVDDFSSDGSRNKIDKIKDTYNLKIILNEKNYGKGYSLRQGIQLSSGDIIIIQDADLEYDPKDYKRLLEPILEDKADVVYGSRFIGSEKRRVLYFWHSVGNSVLTTFSNMMSNLNLSDMENCYKVFKSHIIKNINLEENRFGFEPEVTAKIAKQNLRIYEVSVNYYGRKYSEGKKITWKDGLSAIRCILKYNIF